VGWSLWKDPTIVLIACRLLVLSPPPRSRRIRLLVFLPGDPLAKVCRAVLQLDAPSFTAGEEFDRFAVGQLYILEIERDHLVRSVLVDQPLQLGEVFELDVTAERDPDMAGVD